MASKLAMPTIPCLSGATASAILLLRTLDPPELLSRFVNLAFADQIIPVKINTLSRNYKNMPSQLFEYQGILLKSFRMLTINLGDQQVLSMNLIVEILTGFYGKVYSPKNLSF